MNATSDIVAKLWNLCHVLRDDGITYLQYVTELTYLLFLKMMQETEQEAVLPEGKRWSDLVALEGIEQLEFYRDLLRDLGRGEVNKRVQLIFANAQTALKQPRIIKKLVTSIDELDWYSAKEEGLGDLYEGLLEKNAGEKKSGAGQYFTPRALIDCMVALMQPQPGELVQDPAAGTGGFLIAADRYIKQNTDDLHDLSTKQQNFQIQQAFFGMELVQDAHRLLLMNMMLHGIESTVTLGDTLGKAGTELTKANLILTNPPFGTKKGGGSPTRDDFTFPTANKQLAFLQHIYRSLKPEGRAAVVLPDNVLFEAGQGQKIRADLMDKCNLHTILRLPTGIFYSPGVKTNVLFFQRGNTEKGNTENVWVYDLRTNMPSFGKRNPLTFEHFAEFITCYGNDPNGTASRTDQGEDGRWRCFSREFISQQDENLDLPNKNLLDIKPPKGFKSFPLKEIATDITIGLSHFGKPEDLSKNSLRKEAYLLQARAIYPDGKINFEDLRTVENLNSRGEKFLTLSGDILISRIFLSSKIRLAIVPESIPESVLFSDSLIRIRIDPKKSSASEVYQFLRSDTGQLLLQQTSVFGASQLRLSSQQLGNLPIFLPDEDNNNSDRLGNVSVVARKLKVILGDLNSYNDDQDSIDLQSVGKELKGLGSFLVPPTRQYKVLNEYPTPISLAYRRFYDSRFNVYEQLNRLLDLYESASYFCYNTLLADFLRNLDQQTYFIENNGARNSYKTFAMARKIDFIKEIKRNFSQNENDFDLFMPELIQSNFAKYAEELKDLRNELFHSTTASESKQKKILDDNLPKINNLLDELDFIRNYRLIRIPFFFRKKGDFKMRTEIFQGPVARVDEETLNEDLNFEQLKLVEYDHLVMLNSSNQILDLFPFYQLVDDKRTNYETQVCFLKQGKDSLEGESIQGSKTIQLDGIQEFKKLVSKILDQKPEG